MTMKERKHLEARWLSYFTVVYNVVEGILSIFLGLGSGSIALVGFGLDSFVESLSGGVMIWRFSHHHTIAKKKEEEIEAKAMKLIGYTFFLLAGYVLFESLRKLFLQEAPEPSFWGMMLLIISLMVMPLLWYAKHHTAHALQSKSLLLDARQTIACMWLSLAALFGIVLNMAFGLWQADPLAGLFIAYFLIKEGRMAVKEGKTCCTA